MSQGDACTADYQCPSGSCVLDICVGTTAIGQSCAEDHECVSARCTSLTCLYPADCADSFASGALNGIYTIDPDGPAGNAEFDAFCAMEEGGGGWTLVARLYSGQSSMLYDDAEWTAASTEVGSKLPDGAYCRGTGFDAIDVTQLMVCDHLITGAGTPTPFGCNIDSDFSNGTQALSAFVAGTATTDCVASPQKTMEVFNWADNYCPAFWHNSTNYKVNYERSDMVSRARIGSPLNCGHPRGIGSNFDDLFEYDATFYCGSQSKPLPEYVEIYVK